VNNTGSILNPSDDLQLRKAEEALKQIDEHFGQEQADKARAELTRAISQTRGMLERVLINSPGISAFGQTGH